MQHTIRWIVAWVSTCGLASFLTIGANAQQVIVNSSGDRVVIYPDGSWRLYEEADSVLLKTQLSKEQTFSLEDDGISPYESPFDNPGELEEVLVLSNEFYRLTTDELTLANRELSEAIDSKFTAEAQYDQARANKSLMEPDRLEELEEQYDQSIQAIKTARDHVKKSKKFNDEAGKIVAMPLKKKEKALAKLMASHSAYYASRSGTTSPTSVQTTVPNRDRYPGTISAVRIHNEGQYLRQPPTCNTVRDQTDPQSNIRRIVLQRDVLFTHTDQELRPYFRETPLITCSGQLAKIDQTTYLMIEFSVASPNAQRNFGQLEEGSLMRVQLIDGTYINLFNLQGDSGKIDPYSGNTIFVGRYMLNKDQKRAFSKKELDMIRVVWSTGYEDYEIYTLDFLKDQLACLDKIQ